MLKYTELENKNVLVIGLAKSGYEAAKLLKTWCKCNRQRWQRSKSRCTCNDLENMGITVIGGEHPLSLLDSNPIIFKNPGIPYNR